MSESVDIATTVESDGAEVPSELKIEIKISNQNLQYKSDFSEAETIFWLEAVKSLVIKNTFDQISS